MAEKVINTGGRFHDTSSKHTVTGANEILDDDLQKKQSVINAEQQEINQEQEVINADTYRKNEVYNKEETNNIISRTPETDVIVVNVPEGTDIATYLEANIPNTQVPETQIVKDKLVGQETKGYFYGDDGTLIEHPQMNYYAYTVNSSLHISVGGCGVPSSGYQNIALVEYFNGDTFLGYDDLLHIEHGPYLLAETPIVIPATCNKLIINTQKNYIPYAYNNTEVIVPGSYKSSRANKIYRVPGPENTTFSEWAWDGTQWVMLDEKDYGIDNKPISGSLNPITSGAVFEIAAKDKTEVIGVRRNGYVSMIDGSINVVSDYIHFYFPATEEHGYHIHVPSFTQNSQFTVCGFVFEQTQDGYVCEGIDESTITAPTTLDLDVTTPEGCIGIVVTSRSIDSTGIPTVIGNEVVDVNTYVEQQLSVVNESISQFYKGFWLCPNHLVNHPGHEGQHNYFTPSPDFDCVIFTIPQNAKTVGIKGITYLFMDAFDNYDISSWSDIEEGSVGNPTEGTDLSEFPAWKVIIATIRKSDNVGVDYSNIYLEWTFDDTLEKTVDDNQKNISQYARRSRHRDSLLEGQFPDYTHDGAMLENQNVNSWVYNGINPSNVYFVDNLYAPSSGWTDFPFVHYYNGSVYLGCDEALHIEVGPYRLDGKAKLNVPNNCNKILVDNFYALIPGLTEYIISDNLYSQDIKDDVEEVADTTKSFTYSEEITSVVESGKRYIHGGGIDDLAPNAIYKFNVSEGHIYAFTAKFSSSYIIDVCSWLDSEENLILQEVTSGGDNTNFIDYWVKAPEGAAYLYINNHYSTYPGVTLKEVYVGSPIKSQELQNQIDAISGGGYGKRLMKVTKSGTTIYMRTALNDNEDIIVEYILWRNNNYTWNSTYLGRKEDSDSVILGNRIQNIEDSTAPLCITDPAPWHLWTQHGYCIPIINATHSLTSDDIGSVWQDYRERRYVIGNINGNTIYLLPVIRETEFSGVYTRDWKSPTSVNNPTIGTLSHVSGGTHTSDIVPTSESDTQLRPIMTLASRRFVVDGHEITEDGTYICDEFVIAESLNCTDPWTVETWFPTPIQREVGAVLTQTFTMCGLSCRYDTILDMKKPYIFSWYGANQVQHFVQSAQLSGYDVYGMIPRVRKNNYSSPYLVNDTTRGGEVIYRTSEDLYNINKQADRFITYLKNSSTADMKIGCASGLSLTRGITRDVTRNEVYRVYQSGDRELLSISAGLLNKAYFKVLTDSNFTNKILPASYIAHFSTYLTYFDPMANTGQVYWYKDIDGYVVYAHYQTAQSKTAIKLPACMEGLGVSVVDTDGVTVLTDAVENGMVYVNSEGSGHDYIVLKVR